MKTSRPLREALLVIGFGILILAGLPRLLSPFGLMQATVCVIMAVFALSQGFVWGYGGIMSFGQATFLGIGAYTYAVAAINFGDSTAAIALAVAVPALLAAALGYFMFYGRISDAYVGIVTLTLTIILFSVFNSSTTSSLQIGATGLGGFNGITGVPPINLPGHADAAISPEGFWYLSAALLIVVYAILKRVVATRFGHVVQAVRENEIRATLLGYDARRYKLATFVIGAAIAGLAGCLYTNWGAFISPTVFSLALSAQAIIYVMVGGLGTLIGPILGAFAIQYLISITGTQQTVDANLVLGVIFLVFVLLVPQGVIPVLRDGYANWRRRRVAQRSSDAAVERVATGVAHTANSTDAAR
ncbi:MAG: branched-chain amino acid ABC transporter permease [Janthinobacterium lividum]